MARWVVRAAVATAAFIAAPSWALDTGQCLPAAQVRAALAAEGMNPIIVGNRTGYGYPTSLIFFSNADGSKGYLVRGDKPMGQQADTACVDSVYRDVRLNDITRSGIPDWANMTVNRRKVEAICRGHLGYQDMCRPHDQMLANLESNEQHVMLAATGTAINPRDHTVRDHQRIVVTLRPADQVGLINAVTPEGASYMLSAYSSAAFSQYGAAKLDAQ